MLFGHQTNDDNTNQIPDNFINDAATTVSPNPLAADPDTGVSLPATSDDNRPSDTTDNTPTPDTSPHEMVSPINQPDAVSDAATTPEPEELSTPELTPEPAPEVVPSVAQTDNDDLLSLKQQALGELTPLVDHLDQTPEEKFRTTMMMIQSTDNQALLKDAYAAAQTITDEKVRAQALLDVINEINYFTQNK